MSMLIFGKEIEGIYVSNMVDAYTNDVCRTHYSIDNHYYMIAYLCNREEVVWGEPYLCELNDNSDVCRIFKIDNEKYNLEEFWVNEHPTNKFGELISQVTGKSIVETND